METIERNFTDVPEVFLPLGRSPSSVTPQEHRPRRPSNAKPHGPSISLRYHYSLACLLLLPHAVESLVPHAPHAVERHLGRTFLQKYGVDLDIVHLATETNVRVAREQSCGRKNASDEGRTREKGAKR